MSIIISRVRELLEKKGFNPINTKNVEDQILLPGVNFKNGGGYNLIFNGRDFSNDNLAAFISLTAFPIKVPLNKREKISKFLNAINTGGLASWLAINMEEGEIICRSGLFSKSNDAISEDIIDPLIFSTSGRLDNLQPYIMELIYSEKTVEDILKEMSQTAK
jgi:hypothetical protein